MQDDRLRIFVSHQKADSDAARDVANALSSAGWVDVYLDVLDPYLSKPADDLTDYLRSKLEWSNLLVAVVSTATRYSWWVPFEIGVAVEKARPLATVALNLLQKELPSYLWKWPYVTNPRELPLVVHVALATRPEILQRSILKSASANELQEYSRTYHKELRARLRQ
jgi:hypothetical protein